MIAHLWQSFGGVGFLSITLWLGSLAVLALYWRSRQRTRYWLGALAAALLGLGLAHWNSIAIDHIQLDRTSEEADARQRQHDLQEEGSPRSPRLQFAEDAPGDKDDPAGKKPDDDSAAYAYRQQGKQQRITPTNSAPTVVAAGAKSVVEEDHTRRMRAADLREADQDDRVNLFMARATCWLALFLVGVDYFSRVNRTLDHLPPLPIAGRLLDSIYPKSHAVFIANRDDRLIRRYLESTVRRGENFIYYGPTDPLPEAWLPRIQVERWKFGRLPKMVSVAGQPPLDSDFIHESAWFSRYCFVVSGEAEARRRFEELHQFLRIRHLTRAFAWRTVHIVWNCDSPVPTDDLKTFAYLCREANFKLVVFSSAQPAQATAGIYEEIVA